MSKQYLVAPDKIKVELAQFTA